MATQVKTAQIADAKVTLAKIAGEAWISWNPTVEGITVGAGGTLAAKYIQIGKTIHINIKFVFGTGSAVSGQITFTPPVSASDTHNSMNCIIEDSGSADIPGLAILVAGKIYCYAINTAGTYATQAVFANNVPMTWTTNDALFVSGTYQAS